MTTTVGRGEHFRRPSWLERVVRHVRRGHAAAPPASLRRAHEFVLDRLPGNHLVSTLPGGERVRVSAQYRHVSWNPEEYRAFREAVRPGAIVLDAGANVGAYTLLFALWAAPNGRVIAFEPAPAAVAGLRRHLELNGLQGIVDVETCAVSNATGRAPFSCDEASGANRLTGGVYAGAEAGAAGADAGAAGAYTAAYTGADRAAGAGARTVETTSLDAFCEARNVRPDVVKIDVEGAELDVLRGARRILASRDVHVFVELHPSIWRARGIAPDDVRAELALQRLAAEPLDPSMDPWNSEGIAVRLRHT